MEQKGRRDGAVFFVWIVALGALVLAATPLIASAAAETAAVQTAAAETATAESAGGEAGAVAAAADLGLVTNLPVPRYVSLRSAEINVRRGPGLDYRKDWVFRRAGLPVKIVEEYGDWRRIVDKDEAGGWVYHAMLTGRRTVLVVEDGVVLREKPAETAPASARAEQGVVARLGACRPDWCEIEAEGYSGWVRKPSIWGVDADEVVED